MRWMLDERSARPEWRRFSVTLLLVLLACLLSLVMERWFSTPPLLPYYGAVALAVWYGGLIPALVAAGLSIVAYSVFVLPPHGQWSLTADDTPRTVAFLLFSLFLSLLSLSRDRTEDELRASERRFRTMLETANEGIWLIDRDARTQYANDRMASLLGTTPAQVHAGSVLDFVFPEDESAARQHIAANLGGRAEEFDFRFRRADGEEVQILAGTSPVRDGAGRVVGALGLFTDITARRNAEAGLSSANERFALAADAVQSLIYEWDLQTGHVERSGGLFPLLGYRPEEAPIDQPWWQERIHPDDRERFTRAEWRSEPHNRFSQQYRMRHRDGHWIMVWDQSRIVRDAQGRIVRIVGSVIDITGRTEAEQALRLLDEAGRTMASSLDYEATLQRVAWFAVPALADWCVVDLVDEQGIARRVAVAHADPGDTDLAARLMRYPPTAGIDGPQEQVIHTGDALYVAQVSDELLQTAAQDADHLEVLRAIGVVSAVIAPLRAGGKVHGALSMATTTASSRRFDADDFALVKQLSYRSAAAIQNARLYRDAQAAEERYRGLFEGTKDGILVVNPEGICVDVNSALLEMVGYGREELVGQPAPVITAGGPWSGAEQERLHRDRQWRGDFELRQKHGATVPVESWVTRVTWPSGPVYVGVLRDVSERLRFERLQEEFLSALAHDLKNPLTTMRGQTQLLRRRIARGEPPDEERLDASLEGIDTAAVRMTRLLDELVDVTRLRAGQEIDLSREPADLVELAQRSVDEQARTTERHQLRLLADMDALPGSWDGPRLERVLANLLGNAIKYSPEGGEIVVRISREGTGAGATAVLTVEDHGVGIPADDFDLIFERFQRAGNVERIAGSGIGLAGAKRIVELHGGTISVASKEGEGSTFTVRLPIALGDS